MPIGGLREKSMAAYKAGIHTVIIPEENTADLEEVDDIVKEKIKFVPVKQISEVLEIALERKNTKHKSPASTVNKRIGATS